MQAVVLFLFALSIGYFVILVYFSIGWRRNPVFKKSGAPPFTRVSVLIAARNEEDNIGRTLTDLVAQDYPAKLTEIIVIDDHSTDNTADIARSYADRGVRLLLLREEKPLNSYKKKAIAGAIQISSGSLIVTTDADCRMGPAWLSTLVAFYEAGNHKMISAPVVFFEDKTFFEKLQTLEFFYLIGLGASMIGNGDPTTCNGANLAYRKDVFTGLGGFSGIDDLASGDDELLLHKVASAYPDGIGFCRSAEAMVYTHAKPDLKAFLVQRKRWASKTVKYKNKSMIALGVFIWIFNVSLLATALLGIFWAPFALKCMLALLVKFAADLLFLFPIADFAGKKWRLLLLPVLSVVHVVYFVYVGIAGNSGKYLWKGRMVR